MWSLYEVGELTPQTRLTGTYIGSEDDADVDAVLEEIKAVMAEEEARQERLADDPP